MCRFLRFNEVGKIRDFFEVVKVSKSPSAVEIIFTTLLSIKKICSIN